MNNTTEMMKVHGFTQLAETEHPIQPNKEGKFMQDINKILPGTLFAVYDARADNPGYYVVEHIEVLDYEEA